MNPEPRGWLVEIGNGNYLRVDENSYRETPDALLATTFVTHDAASFAALHHLGEEGLQQARLAPLY